MENKIPCKCGHNKSCHDSIAFSFIYCTECYKHEIGNISFQSIHLYQADNLKYLEELYVSRSL